MKIRASGRSRKLVLQMSARDSALPPISVPELRLKTILSPVDFSDCSRKALLYVACLAKQFNADVLLLHVVEIVPIEGQFVPAESHEQVQQRLSEWRREFALPASVKTVLRDGIFAHEQIVQAAAEYNCDLIVVGNHGRAGLSRVLLGSTAEKVVRHAPCPVLVIREREHDFISS
jgi:universal stress protein A